MEPSEHERIMESLRAMSARLDKLIEIANKMLAEQRRKYPDNRGD